MSKLRRIHHAVAGRRHRDVTAPYGGGGVLASTAMLIVGSSVAVSESITRYPVLTGQAIRYGLAALVLWVWASVRGASVRPLRTEVGRLVVLGAAGLAAFNVFLVLALQEAEPAAVGVVVGAVPIVLAILGPLLAGSRPAARVVVAATVVTVGAAVVHRGGGEASLAAVLLALGAMVSEAAFSLVAEPLLPRLGATSISLLACCTATVFLAAAAPIVHAHDAFRRPSATEAAGIVYLAVVVTALAFVLWYEGLQRLGSARAGLFAGLVPVSALFTAAAIGTGHLTVATTGGTTVVAFGLLLGLFHRGQG